jgi:hypothetical protein
MNATCSAVVLVFVLAFGLHHVPAVGAQAARTVFPLKVSQNKRYLVDSSGRPFFIHGDSPWEMLWQLTSEEAVEFLDNRAAKGFNTLLIDVLPYTEWSDPLTETNRYRHRPFLTPGDFATPDPEYFNHLQWLLEQMQQRGMLAALVCADLGHVSIDLPQYKHKGGMWYPQYLANGAAKCEQYGLFLGGRFSRNPNILWVLGGDRDPQGVMNEVQAMARGLQASDPGHLRTYHAGAKSGGTFFQNETWFDINMSYGYGDTWEFVLADYMRQPARPCFLGESGYEGENLDRRGGSAQRIRRQAYWAVLSGACGHLYGSAAWTVRPLIWRMWLESPGARHMAHLGRLFRALPWHLLVPDAKHEILTGGQDAGPGNAATAAADARRSVAVVYMPSSRTITLDLARFHSPVRVRWFDPTNGTYRRVGTGEAGGRKRQFTPPPKNSAGEGDWVLLIQSQAR